MINSSTLQPQVTSKLTVVVPTLNEAGNISDLIYRIQKSVPGTEVLVVDDGSTDGTQAIVKQMNKTNPRVHLIDRSQKIPCLTRSIAEGVEKSKTEFVAWMDADLSHPPELLQELLQSAEKFGCAIASRFIRGGAQKKAAQDTPDSALAIALSTQLNFLARFWLRLPITDFTSGFIVCKRNYLEDYRFIGDYGEYFLAVMFFLTKKGVQIKEIPFLSEPRKYGESKTGVTLWRLFRRGLKYLLMAMKLPFLPYPKTLKALDKSKEVIQSY